MRASDWSAASLGPPEAWPAELRNAVSLLLAASIEMVLFWGVDGIAFYNDACAATLGDRPSETLGRPGAQAWPEMWDDLAPLLAHVRATGETFAARDRQFVVARGGRTEEVYFDLSFSAVRTPSGAVGGVLCIIADTTERVRAARAVAADNARLAAMFEDAPGFIAVLREPDGTFELANGAFRELIGPWRGDIVGRTLRHVLPELPTHPLFDALDRAVAQGRQYRADGVAVALRRDGPGAAAEMRYLDFACAPMFDANGVPDGVFVQGSDVTDRHRAETALALSRESLELATAAAELGTWDYEPATGRLDWSPRTREIFGVADDARLSLDDFYDRIHPEDVATVRAALEAAFDPGTRALYDMEMRLAPHGGDPVRWIAAKGRGIFADGRCVRAVGTVIDITARQRERAALRESEARFRALADSLPALVWIGEEDGTLTFANRYFEEVFGVAADVLARDGWLPLLHPDDHEAMRELFDSREFGGQPFGGDVRLLRRDGTVRWMHVESRPRVHGDARRGHVGCAIDVSEAHLAGEALERRVAERTLELTRQIGERERIEETLHQMQRLEAVGQLTSGVAHDFNNLLTVVLGNVAMIERGLSRAGDDAALRQRLSHVRIAAERGATLTAQLLAFARRQRLEAKVVDLNRTVEAMRGLMQTSLGGAVTVATRLSAMPWPALVDATQIELAILNLAINARDAMGAAGGTLTVETANVTLGDPRAPEEPAAGDYVMVALTDTGSGMTDEVRARVFEPFFTTKDVGKGSGLGLAQVYGFVKQSGGGIRLDTAPGAGTCIALYLPRASAAADEVVVRLPVSDDAAIAGRIVLVLDDDDAVRQVTADELRAADARVIEAGDAAQALVALDAIVADGGVDAVVADFAMPGMNGAQFARAAHARWPALPILFVTGYADLAQLAHVPEELIVQKPYAAGTIARRVCELLERRAAAA